METQNITLSIPKDILLEVKLLAVQRGTSVSGLLTQTLQRLVSQELRYSHARERHLSYLAEVPDLGTEGRSPASREDLHERG